MIIAVDFDGILAEYGEWKGHEHIGKPIKENIEMVKKLHKDGHKLILFTTRLNCSWDGSDYSYEERLKIIQEWLKKQKIWDAFTDITSEKPYADIYWDDRAVSTLKELGRKLKERR